MQTQPFLPWRTVVIFPLSSMVTTDASRAIAAGAADSALLTGSLDAVAVFEPLSGPMPFAAIGALLQAVVASTATPAASQIFEIVMIALPRISEGRSP